jgi:hypothetical protein
MRSLEILLVVANPLAFLLLVVRLPGRARWLRQATPIPLPAMGIQLLVEGPRWQLAPAYALAMLLLLVWLRQASHPAGGPREPGWTGWLAAGLGLLGLAVSVALPVLLPVFRLPQPSGPAAIGTLTYHWMDADRGEVCTDDPHDRRELLVQLWYPGAPAAQAPHTPYLPEVDAVGPSLARLLKLPGFTFGYLRHVTSNAVLSAPVAADEPRYPLLLFLAGGAPFVK